MTLDLEQRIDKTPAGNKRFGANQCVAIKHRQLYFAFSGKWHGKRRSTSN